MVDSQFFANTHRDQQKYFEEVYSKRVGAGYEITCLCWNAANTATVQFASGTRDFCIFLWKLEGRELHSTGSLQLGTTVPRNIGFMDAQGDECYVFGAYNGQW
jgi:hypothetical protein